MPEVKLKATKQLAERRKILGFSQRELTDTLNVCLQGKNFTINTYKSWEVGHRNAPLSVVREISRILQSDISELWEAE